MVGDGNHGDVGAVVELVILALTADSGRETVRERVIGIAGRGALRGAERDVDFDGAAHVAGLLRGVVCVGVGLAERVDAGLRGNVGKHVEDELVGSLGDAHLAALDGVVEVEVDEDGGLAVDAAADGVLVAVDYVTHCLIPSCRLNTFLAFA